MFGGGDCASYREAGVTQENVIVCLDSRKIFLLFQLQFFRSWNYFALQKKESKLKYQEGNMHELAYTATNC